MVEAINEFLLQDRVSSIIVVLLIFAFLWWGAELLFRLGKEYRVSLIQIIRIWIREWVEWACLAMLAIGLVLALLAGWVWILLATFAVAWHATAKVSYRFKLRLIKN